MVYHPVDLVPVLAVMQNVDMTDKKNSRYVN